MTTTPPTAETLNVRLAASHGSTLGAERNILDFTEDDTVTINQSNTIAKELAGAATDQSVNINSYVDTCKLITILDRGGTGFKVGFASGGTKARVGPNKAFVVMWNSTVTPPTLYLDNEHATDTAFLEIGIGGSSS